MWSFQILCCSCCHSMPNNWMRLHELRVIYLKKHDRSAVPKRDIAIVLKQWKMVLLWKDRLLICEWRHATEQQNPFILAHPFETVSTSKQSSDLLVPVPYILQPIILLSWNSFQDKNTVHNTYSSSRFTARQIDWISYPLRQMWGILQKELATNHNLSSLCVFVRTPS